MVPTLTEPEIRITYADQDSSESHYIARQLLTIVEIYCLEIDNKPLAGGIL